MHIIHAYYAHVKFFYSYNMAALILYRLNWFLAIPLLFQVPAFFCANSSVLSDIFISFLFSSILSPLSFSLLIIGVNITRVIIYSQRFMDSICRPFQAKTQARSPKYITLLRLCASSFFSFRYIFFVNRIPAQPLRSGGEHEKMKGNHRKKPKSKQKGNLKKLFFSHLTIIKKSSIIIRQ